jgi:uncharacterized membrane protein YhhN
MLSRRGGISMTIPQRALLALSAILAIAYGALGASLYENAPPFVMPALFKASGIVLLAIIALRAGGSRLLAAGLLFGALGDALLALSDDTFLAGAASFLIGHLFYIALFLSSGLGARALTQPPRLVAALALITAAIIMTLWLVPSSHALFIPLGIYTGVLTVMALASFTLPSARWLAMAGALLFFASDGFVAATMFHPLEDSTLTYWRSFAGWMIYWAGQTCLCFGALGLHRAPPAQ